ncbi:hypothetical protein Tco_0851530 [Tanacetum coccineum]
MEVTNCGFVRWVDPPMCERDVDVILRLLRARNVLEEDLEDHVLMLREKENGQETKEVPGGCICFGACCVKYF